MLMWGKTPVPWTASWSEEESFGLGFCPYFPGSGHPAIVQPEKQGAGKPMFAKPHSNRQRRAMAHCLCDICGKSLRAATKVSLSHARPTPLGAAGFAIMQVEPMMHRECAAIAVQHCPTLKRDLAAGAAVIRQVFGFRAQVAIMDAPYVSELTGKAVCALGHGKIELLKWRDRAPEWIGL